MTNKTQEIYRGIALLIAWGLFIWFLAKTNSSLETKLLILSILFLTQAFFSLWFERMDDRLNLIYRWIRANFTANQIRNEKKNLESALKRVMKEMKEEEEYEGFMEELSGSYKYLDHALALVFIVVLYFLGILALLFLSPEDCPAFECIFS